MSKPLFSAHCGPTRAWPSAARGMKMPVAPCCAGAGAGPPIRQRQQRVIQPESTWLLAAHPDPVLELRRERTRGVVAQPEPRTGHTAIRCNKTIGFTVAQTKAQGAGWTPLAFDTQVSAGLARTRRRRRSHPQHHAPQHHGHTQPLPHAHAQGKQAQVRIGLSEKFGHKTEKPVTQ